MVLFKNVHVLSFAATHHQIVRSIPYRLYPTRSFSFNIAACIPPGIIFFAQN